MIILAVNLVIFCYIYCEMGGCLSLRLLLLLKSPVVVFGCDPHDKPKLLFTCLFLHVLWGVGGVS